MYLPRALFFIVPPTRGYGVQRVQLQARTLNLLIQSAHDVSVTRFELEFGTRGNGRLRRMNNVEFLPVVLAAPGELAATKHARQITFRTSNSDPGARRASLDATFLRLPPTGFTLTEPELDDEPLP